jgi:hypothetical protein
MISTEHVIDFDNLVLTDKDVFGDWEDLICEYDGYYSQESQTLFFDFKDIEVIIGFDLAISGTHWYQPASYMQPEEGETEITDINIDVNYLWIGDDEVKIDSDLKKTLTAVVKKYVNYE